MATLSLLKTEFTRHVFATLTYDRNISLQDSWKNISKDYNRFNQRLNRLHACKVEYLRVIEEHKDNYPHIHALLQYPDARIRVENSRYFDRALYQKWKSLWPPGHSDYQKPMSSRDGIIPYLMKYLLKNQTAKTIWKKLLSDTQTPTTEKHESTSEIDTKPSNSSETSLSAEPPIPQPTHLNGVKLASWSRGFDWTLVTPQKPKIGKQANLI